MRPVLEQLHKERIRDAENAGGNWSICGLLCELLELAVVYGEVGTCLGAVLQRSNDSDQGLHHVRAIGRGCAHHNYRFGGDHQLPQRVQMLHDKAKAVKELQLIDRWQHLD